MKLFILNKPNTIILSNTNQWAELINFFRDKYPHFESFRIALPHARGNQVNGIGIKEKVISFYEQFAQLGIIKKVDPGTYQITSQSQFTPDTLPEGVTVIYLQDKEDSLVYLGTNQGVKIMPLKKAIDLVNQDRSTTIITNQGKLIAGRLFEEADISDVCIMEKIIRNGESKWREVTIQSILECYGYSKDTDTILLISNLYQIRR